MGQWYGMLLWGGHQYVWYGVLYGGTVHEKSLLFPLVPVSFLVVDEPLLVWWLALLGNFRSVRSFIVTRRREGSGGLFVYEMAVLHHLSSHHWGFIGVCGPCSMFPLLQRDHVVLPYLATTTIYTTCLLLTYRTLITISSSEGGSQTKSSLFHLVFAPFSPVKKLVVAVSHMLPLQFQALLLTEDHSYPSPSDVTGLCPHHGPSPSPSYDSTRPPSLPPPVPTTILGHISCIPRLSHAIHQCFAMDITTTTIIHYQSWWTPRLGYSCCILKAQR